MNLLFVDNYDSFSYNVVHLLASQGASVRFMHADDPHLSLETLAEIDGMAIGPGPGRPSDTPLLARLIAAAIERDLPTLGICLGQQAIGETLGARVIHAPRPMHGKTDAIRHEGRGLFAGLPSPFQATRYHSLALEEGSLPAGIEIHARSSDGVVQGIAVTGKRCFGLQFHPESVLSECGEALIANFLTLAST